MDPAILTDWVRQRARARGFGGAGVATVVPRDAAPLRAWLAAGYHADMAYLHRHLPLRVDLTRVMPEAQSVICVALPYSGAGNGGLIARHARGRDYHDVVMEGLQALWADIAGKHPDAQGRLFVDSSPLPERELARSAGLGWPGGHGCLIHPAFGSRFVLGEILTTLALAPTSPLPGSCGTCRRCRDACPTGALLEHGVVDARRCIAYLTIEHKGPIPRDVRARIGTRWFGCDACQDVCPYNQGMGEGAAGMSPLTELLTPDLHQYLQLPLAAFTERFRGTTLHRTGRARLLRNACVVLGNQRAPSSRRPLRAALTDEELLVRGHAAWALGQYGDRAPVRRALARESDPWVREEMTAALDAGSD